MKRSGSRSIMRTPITISRPASAPPESGDEIAEDQRRHQREDALDARRSPASRAPLLQVLAGGAIVPAPGMPPTADAATLAMPWATSSRLESWRVRVS